jgi:hypothetical protein
MKTIIPGKNPLQSSHKSTCLQSLTIFKVGSTFFITFFQNMQCNGEFVKSDPLSSLHFFFQNMQCNGEFSERRP